MNNKTNIFIPKKIRIGFQERPDTYTKKLAYVIYYDNKGVLRKEKSWNDWISKYMPPEEYEAEKLNLYNQDVNNARRDYVKIPEMIQRYTTGPYANNTQHSKRYIDDSVLSEEEYVNKYVKPYDQFDVRYRIRNTVTDSSYIPCDYDNDPIDGFVLNKKVGDYKSGWDHRQSYCRVYDPRGFEFEITIDNLLYILENTSSIIGKGLEGKFIYGWHGTQLVLIPEQAPEFQDMLKFTELQSKSLKRTDLIVGGIYLNNKNEQIVYLGYEHSYSYGGVISSTKSIFIGYTGYDKKLFQSIGTCNINTIKEYTGNNVDNLGELMDILDKDRTYTPAKKFMYEYELVASLTRSEIDDMQVSWSSLAMYIKNKTKGYTRVKVYKRSYIRSDENPYYINSGYRKNSKILYEFKSLNEMINSQLLYRQIIKSI